jgi:hAT family C-terminal dimerisation region
VYCDVVVPQQPQFWADLNEIIRFLSPFQVATDIMQSDSSTIYELYQQFTTILRHVDSTPSTSCFHSAISDIHNLILTVVDTHVDMDLVVACSLLSFDTHTASLFPDRLKKAEKAFVEFAAQYTFYWNCAGHSTIEEARMQSFAEWTAWNARAPGSGFEEMEDEVSRLKSYYIYSNRQTSSNGNQFTRWNPRLAWANHVRTAPVISLGAIALLSVAGSEAAVERTFSAQGKVHSKGRNRLRDESVEAEMFCRFNGAALERKVQEKDTGHWIELTEDYEEVEQVVTAGLFLARVAREQEEHEDEKQREEEERKGEEEAKEDRSEERKEPAEEKKEEQAPLPSVSRIPDPPLPATADDVHRFIVDYVRKAPWPSRVVQSTSPPSQP